MISNNKQFEREDILKISRELEKYHCVFDKFWSIARPRFDDSVDTAAVAFDAKGQFIDFIFNKNFWNQLGFEERIFVIVHECLHLILGHGPRIVSILSCKKYQNDEDKHNLNVAADLVINELALHGFKFDKDKLPWITEHGCWLDKYGFDAGNSMEYYFQKLTCQKNAANTTDGGEGSGIPLDDHSGLSGFNADDIKDVVQQILEELNEFDAKSFVEAVEGACEGELEEATKDSGKGQGGQLAGTMAGSIMKIIKIKSVKKKRKWETVIKKWASNYLKHTDRDDEQWARINRRFVSVQGNFFLPSEMEMEEIEKEKKKIDVVFFLDTSGSCAHLAERFFKAAKSLPEDRFNVIPYCFDTRVYSVNLDNGRLYGFGGTSFYILEDEIQRICKGELAKYPKAVFVITDGYGDTIKPAKPKNWYWFMTTKYKHCIPPTCNFFELSKFE